MRPSNDLLGGCTLAQVDDRDPAPLNDATPSRSNGPIRIRRLVCGLICIVMSIAGVVTAYSKSDALPEIMPLPDPPPPPTAQQRFERNQAQSLFVLGCCGGVPLGVLGLILFFTAFAAPHHPLDGRP